MLGGGEADVGPPVSAGSRSSPGRPLLLRSDVPLTPEGSSDVPVEGSVDGSAGSVSGGYSRRAIETYEADLRAETLAAAEEEGEYVFPQGVLDRLAVQESLSVAARRRRKRGREDETAELDDAGGGRDNDGEV